MAFMQGTVKSTGNFTRLSLNQSTGSSWILTPSASGFCLPWAMILCNVQTAKKKCSFLSCITNINWFLWRNYTKRLCANIVCVRVPVLLDFLSHLFHTVFITDERIPLMEQTYIDELRQKYIKNPPEGMIPALVRNMTDSDLLDMHYFLTEDDDLDDDEFEEGFYINLF